MKRIASIVVAGLILFSYQVSAHASLLLFFDDFEAGNFNNWNLTNISNTNFFVDTPSANGVGNQTIELFDTNNDSVSSLSAKFQVGKAVVDFSQMAGIVLSRDIYLPASSRLHATADVAATHLFDSINGEPGRFDLYFDGPVVRDSVEFDEITGPNGALYDSLDLTTGMYSFPGTVTLNIRITRNALARNTPFQYLDNVKVEALDLAEDPRGEPNVVPEPATLALFTTGLLGAFVRRRFKS